MNDHAHERTSAPPRSEHRSRPPVVEHRESPRSRKAELVVALVLTGIILIFHAVRLANAGGLWRDEAATAHLAANFSPSYALNNSEHEIFPILLPAMLHGYSWVAGTGDTALRIFGMLTGIAIVGALWWNVWMLRRGVPLFSLLLLGFNGTFIQWGDAVRSYGLGIFFMLMSVGLIWRMVEQPTPWRIALAALAVLASVQCLFNNAVLILAVCLGAMAVALKRRAAPRAAFVLAIGVAAALSLLPYLGPLRRVREWDMLVQWPVDLVSLCSKLGEALSASGWWHVVIWTLLFLAGLLICLVGQFHRNPFQVGREHRDLLLFSGIALAVAVIGYFSFLKAAGYPTQPWYYLALMALAALLLDFIFDVLQKPPWTRLARLAIVAVAACASLVLTLRQAQVRQTNVDLVAAKLRQAADQQDLVVVTPWYDGISFNRYYAATGSWMTVPPIHSHELHRYDLVKAQMILPDMNDSIRPLLDKISETLRSGHRVWVAGTMEFLKPGAELPNLSPAPDPNFGWHDEPYTTVWSLKVAAYLQASARRREVVPIEFKGPINRYENLSLTVFSDWGGL